MEFLLCIHFMKVMEGEKLWLKVKAFLRKFKARTLDALPNAIQNAFHSVTISDCSGWFRFCGYAL